MNQPLTHPMSITPGASAWIEDRLTEARGILIDAPGHRDSLVILAARVVAGQRMIQGSPDIFLGGGPADGKPPFYYVRQLADMKGGITFEAGDKNALSTLDAYCRLCGWALALAHAKSGDAATIAGYCGKSDTLAAAISTFALTYADQTERDHDALLAAIRAGRFSTATG